MVDALKKIHLLLIPGGILINVHKYPQPLQIEIHSKGKQSIVGHLEHPDNFKNERLAMESLVQAVEEGLFMRDDELIFEYNIRANTIDELSAKRADEWISAFLSDTISTRVQDKMKKSGNGAQVNLRIKAWMARFKANLGSHRCITPIDE